MPRALSLSHDWVFERFLVLPYRIHVWRYCTCIIWSQKRVSVWSVLFLSRFFNSVQHANEDVEKMILGNKCDMEDKRMVSRERGEAVSHRSLLLLIHPHPQIVSYLVPRFIDSLPNFNSFSPSLLASLISRVTTSPDKCRRNEGELLNSFLRVGR